MERTQILEQITQLFKDTLDLDALTLNENSTAAEIEEWDSLSHIQLVVAIEKCFKIRFAAAEIQRWQNVGEMVNSIQQKLN